MTPAPRRRPGPPSPPEHDLALTEHPPAAVPARCASRLVRSPLEGHVEREFAAPRDETLSTANPSVSPSSVTRSKTPSPNSTKNPASSSRVRSRESPSSSCQTENPRSYLHSRTRGQSIRRSDGRPTVALELPLDAVDPVELRLREVRERPSRPEPQRSAHVRRDGRVARDRRLVVLLREFERVVDVVWNHDPGRENRSVHDAIRRFPPSDGGTLRPPPVPPSA